jgi:hypothetical protein
MNSTHMKILNPKCHLLIAVLIADAFLSSIALAASPFTTEGKFSVGNDGSANYSIPIVVPPGTAGMQPQLALNYSSNGGNGIVGMGWGIDGLSQISRCATTLEQDGVINGVNYTNTDRFCLDGQRLIATTDTYNTSTKQYATTSAYGANGTEYRTESANFAKIISYGVAGTGPAYFKVWTKGGQIIEYGNTADSGIEAQGKPTIRTWGVNKISDTKGNYITVTYTEDNANGEAYVQRIDYTGNATSTPAVAPYANIQLIYEARPDITAGYQAGSILKTTKRLTNIQTYNGSTQVKNYKLAYEQSQSTNRSRLKSMQECDGIGSCKLPSNFNWNVSNNFGFASTFNPIAPGSINGGTEVYLGDWNGDGLTDFMWYDQASGNQRWYVNTGNMTFAATFNPIAPDSVNAGTGVYLGDWNGDGLTDFMWYDQASGNQRWMQQQASRDFIQIFDAQAIVNLTYRPITDILVYTKDNTSIYPTQDVKAPMYIVASTNVSDGIGGAVITNYQYGGLKSHLKGRGSLGFRYVKESSPDSGLSVTSFYRQDFPFIGLPSQVEKRRLSDNALLSVVQNTYANSDLATSTIISKFPYLSQSVEQAYELDGSLVSTTTTTNEYDSYGNVTSVKVDDGLGNIKTTTSSYSNNVSNWLLGRLIRSTVTSVMP